MVKVKAFGSYDYDMNEIDFSNLLFGVNYVAKGNLFRVEYASGIVDQFKGTGFRYDSDGVPVSGTVKSYTLLDGSSKMATIEGINIAATKIVKAAMTLSSADDIALIRTALKGNDQITGGNGDDTILGYNGNDRLAGGGGADFLVGGKGADTFVFANANHSNAFSADTIQDFSSRQKDRVDLKAIDADITQPGNGKFKFIGEAEFSGKAGELRYGQDGGVTTIEGDVNGDGSADLVINVRGTIDFSASDFLL